MIFREHNFNIICDNRLSEFLLPLISSTTAGQEPEEHHLLPIPESSTLGQPPSISDDASQRTDTLDDEIDRIYKSVNAENPKDIILNETLTEDVSLLMKGMSMHVVDIWTYSDRSAQFLIYHLLTNIYQARFSYQQN